MSIYSPPQLYEDYIVIAWDSEQKYDYNNQQISQYKRVLGITDSYEHVSSIANSVARKCQDANEMGGLLYDFIHYMWQLRKIIETSEIINYLRADYD